MLSALHKTVIAGSVFLEKWKEGHLEFSTEIAVSDGAAPAEWTAGYIYEILEEDHRDEIMDCWTEQEGLKQAIDDTYTEMKNPDT